MWMRKKHSKPLFTIIFNMVPGFNGLKAVSSKTPPILLSELVSNTHLCDAIATPILKDLPFILMFMWMWCNKTIFRVKNLNRNIINV